MNNWYYLTSILSTLVGVIGYLIIKGMDAMSKTKILEHRLTELESDVDADHDIVAEIDEKIAEKLDRMDEKLDKFIMEILKTKND